MSHWKHTGAFVVQFKSKERPERDLFEGRVEHISSGEVLRFKSQEELVSFLNQILDESGEEGQEGNY